MKTILALTAAFTICYGAGASIALAQKGTGTPTGVAQQVAKPKITSLSGTISEIETGPCQATTGRATVGTHLLIETAKGQKLNVHLGPTAAVQRLTERLKTGDKVTVNVFRTEKMLEGHHVAQSIVLGKETFQLRDGNLRPLWAGAGTAWIGRGGPRPDPGFVPTRGGGRGWASPGRGRGGYGRGYGRGQGYGGGYGRGYGQGYGRGYGQGYGCWWAEQPAVGEKNVQDKVD